MTVLHPSLLWLIPALITLLVFLRFYRSRRREVVAGSLLIWRRLAAQQPKTPPRRIVIDRSLLLQCAAVALLVLALAAPSVALGGSGARVLVLVLDNGPLSRAQSGDGAKLWKHIRARAEPLLRALKSDDRVLLARSAPLPAMLAQTPLAPNAALQELEKIQPALSGPAPQDLWLFASDAARSAGGDAAQPALAIISLQAAPENAGERWLCVAPENFTADNVAIVDFGSADIAAKDGVKVQMLARVKNFSPSAQTGSVELSSSGPAQSQSLTLAPGGDGSAVFTLPTGSVQPLLIKWTPAGGKADAFPEDDAVAAVPRKRDARRVRFHTPVPALEELYQSMAQLTQAGDTQPVDLEIYVHSVPITSAIPASSRALMLLAPESDFAGVFSIGPKTLKDIQPQRDEDDPLTRDIGDRPESAIVVREASEILRTGDYKPLLKDAKTGRTLAATFYDERRRPGFLFAFVPGEDLPAQGPLAALLTRMLLRAAGSGDPFTSTRAAALEQQNGAALGADWIKTSAAGGGVLDEKTSALAAGKPSSSEAAAHAGVFQQEEDRVELAALLVLLALALIALELWIEKPSRASSTMPGTARGAISPVREPVSSSKG